MIKKYFLRGALAASIIAGLSITAAGQDNGALRGDDLGVRAAVGFTIPFGYSGPSKTDDKARFSVGLMMDRYHVAAQSGTLNMQSMSIIDAGFFETLEPSLQIYGQELYRPFFDPLYADDADAEPVPTGLERPIERTNNGASVILIGGLVVVGGLVLLNQADERIENCLADIFTSDRC